MYFDNRLTRLSVDEYIFLTENFEMSDKAEIESGVAYILFNRKQNVLNTVRKIINNELNDIEKNIVLDYWGKELSIEELAEKYNLSRAAIYRNINNAKKKIEKFTKYVLVYDEGARQHSVADYLKCIRRNN